MPAFSRADYESLLYALAERYPDISSSTLRLYTNSATHEEPDIKHNRRPAPGISFTAPNLPKLIADCLSLG